MAQPARGGGGGQSHLLGPGDEVKITTTPGDVVKGTVYAMDTATSTLVLRKYCITISVALFSLPSPFGLASPVSVGADHFPVL